MSKVSVILCNHLNENQAYLDLCTRSLVEQDYLDFEVQLISSAPERPEAPPKCTVYHRPDLNNATKKSYFGVANAHPDSKYFLFLSDDVVLSKSCISGMVDACLGEAAIVNPMSNNENGSRFLTNIILKNSEKEFTAPPSCSREDVEGLESELLSYPRGKTLIIPVPWVSFFCTLIPRRLYNAVGALDEKLDARHNDEDFCMRAAKVGFPTLIQMGVFALHFGSKTLNKTTNHSDKEEATRHFLSKWQ